MQRDQINFSYLKRLFPTLEQILYTGKFTSLNEFDKCTQLWHQAGFQGPFFLLKLTDQSVFIILNQNSKQDFIRNLKKGLKFELSKSTLWFYFNFQDEQQKIFNIWFQEFVQREQQNDIHDLYQYSLSNLFQKQIIDMQVETSEQQFEEIYQSLCKDDRFCFDLRIQFEKILKVEIDRYQAYHDFSEFLSGLAKEPFQETPSLMDLLDELKKAIQEVNSKLRDKINDDQDKGLIKLIKTKIISSLSDGQRAVETQKKALAEYKEKAAIYKKLDSKKNDLLQKNDDKLLQLEKQLQEAKREKSEKGQTFNFTYKNYIEDKNDELKGLFKHFFNRLLLISSAGLQSYSAAIHKIHTTDEKQEVQTRLSKLGIIKHKKQ
ncbi:unnamed protein product [Paramecium sonneborni]|uniref:Uncharacterized protein n=1 Tax=Paramecium sonneborni TaxID=65129 RepID=A0A8S1P9G6_9CILI|nr:unnamed protein product [Paramecium sonneborni]